MTSKNQLFWFPIFLVWYEFITYISNDMFLPAMLTMQEFFNCSLVEAQSMVGYWMVGAFSITLLLGPVNDFYGRKPVLLSGVICFIIGTLICIFSQTLTPFLIGRVLQGLATCSLGSAGYATIQELYTGVKAIQIISRMAAVAVLAPCMGPMIGSWILQIGPWQYIFITVLIGGIISLVGLIYSMPETLHERASKLSFGSAIHHYKLILSVPSFIYGNLCNGLFWGALMCWITTSPAIIMDEFNLPASAFGKLQIPVFGSYFLGALIADRLAAKIETKKIISFGIVCALLSSFFMASKSFVGTLSFKELLCGMSAFAIGNGLSCPPNFRFTVASIPYSMSFKSALFNFNSAGIATLFTFMSSHLYKGNSSIITYILFFTAITIAACFRVATKPQTKIATIAST